MIVVDTLGLVLRAFVSEANYYDGCYLTCSVAFLVSKSSGRMGRFREGLLNTRTPSALMLRLPLVYLTVQGLK